MSEIKGKGALPESDLRLVKKLLPKKPGARNVTKGAKTERLWTTMPALDQKQTNQCVAYSGVQWLAAAPVINITDWYKDPYGLYQLAQKYDGMKHREKKDGTFYDDGSNLGGLFKALKRKGFVKEYLYAGNTLLLGEDYYYRGTEIVDAIVFHVLEKSPVLVTSQWLNSMGNSREDLVNDFLQVDATLGSQGTHAYLVKGVDLEIKNPDGSFGAFRILNSWGEGWGDKGEAWLGFRDADVLFSIGATVVTSDELLKGTRIG